MKAAQTLMLKDPTLPSPIDVEHVLRLFRRSANAGHAPAGVSLGKYYDNRGDRGEAIQWFMKAARQGDDEARQHLTRIQQRQQEQVELLRQDQERQLEEEEEGDSQEEEEEKEGPQGQRGQEL
jgi:TPR repeat protein